MPEERDDTERLLREIEVLRSRVTSLEKKEASETGAPDRWADSSTDTLDKRIRDSGFRETEQASRALLNATADSALLIDKNGIIIDANDKLAASLGKSRESILGTVIYDYFPPDLAEQRKTKESVAARDKKLVRFEDFRDGRWLENSVYPVFDRDGELVQFAIFSHDITQHKRAEKALQESEERYRLLVTNIPSVSWMTDEIGNTVYISPTGRIPGKRQNALLKKSATASPSFSNGAIDALTARCSTRK